MTSRPAPRALVGARVRVSELSDGGTSFDLSADKAECAAIAAKLEIEAIDRLEAHLDLRPWGKGGASVQGMLDAHVRQICVVTLEPVESDVRAEIDEKFAPQDTDQGEIIVDIGDPDEAGPLINGEIEIGELVIDSLATALDPYPRAPGAELELGQSEPGQGGEDEARDSPFAALAALKTDPPAK